MRLLLFQSCLLRFHRFLSLQLFNLGVLRTGGGRRSQVDCCQAARVETGAGLLWLSLFILPPKVALAQESTTMDLATLEARSLEMIAAGTPERALRAANMIVEATRDEMRRNLPALDEAGRLKFLRDLRPYDIPASVGAGRAVAQGAIMAKGIVLESLLEDRRAARMLGLGKDIARMRVLYEADEGTFTWRFLKITVADVLSRLPPGMAVIEMVRYRRHSRGEQAVDWYGAAILRPGIEPTFVPAGPARDIDAAVRAYRSSIEAVASGDIDDRAVELGSRKLHDLLVAGWYRHLAGVGQVVICPDGALNFVPFGTLLDEKGKLMSEKGTIYYATSGRDLVARDPVNVIAGAPMIFADPEFGGSGVVGTGATESRAGLGALRFGALPGTRAEAEKVGRVLDQREGRLLPLTKLGGDVTEAALRGVKSPEILHLATHGFFLEEGEERAQRMARSGVALSGAQDSAERYRRGEQINPDQDGILLAEEAGELDLKATELVTLSACRTAVGEIEPGEGVMGLRRALVLAGARNVLMTLWDIADEPTANFMEEFYQRYEDTGNAPLALCDVQREWMVRLRREEGMAVAAYLAGPFVMSAQATRKVDLERQRSEDFVRMKLKAARPGTRGLVDDERD